VFVKVRHVCLAVGGGDGQGVARGVELSLALYVFSSIHKVCADFVCAASRQSEMRVSLEVLRESTWPQASEYNLQTEV
jgi:hypothetical protein